MAGMTRIPSLGPGGEGWVALQILALAGVGAAGLVLPGDAADATSALGLVGLAAILVALAMGIVGSLALQRARSFTMLPSPRDTAQLVETGLYGYIRHPLYAGLILASLGWVAVRASVPALVVTLALAVILDLKRRREEAWLDARFPGYAAYRRRTRAFVPFVY